MPSRDRAPARAGRDGPAWGRIAIIALVVIALAALWRYTPLSELLTRENLNAWAKVVRETPWAPIVLVLAYTPASFVLFPRPLLTLIAVIALGPWIGFACAMSGIVLAALVTYYIGRMLPSSTLERIAGSKVGPAKRRLKKHGLLTIFLIRLVPVAPFAAEGVAAGAARVKVWHYALGTFLAIAPMVLAETVFGTQIGQALKDPEQANYWLAGGAVLFIFGLSAGVAWWKSRST